MFCRNLVKVYTQIIVSISMVLLGASICPVQAEFPRISFIDPYWVHAGFDDYWPQMDSCGITHSVTLGDNISLNNSANIYILDSNLDSVSNYATGIENKYNIGGTESDFSPAEPEYNYYDDDDEIERWVYRVLCDSNSAGVVFSGSFNPWGQRRKRNYWFIFKMKMVGETSGSDTIAQVHVWETSAKSNGSEEELHAGIPWDYLEVGEGEKADDWLYILPNHFDTSGIYIDVELGPIYLEAENCSTHISFEWRGTRDLYIDHLWVRDTYNYNIFVSEDSSNYNSDIKESLYSKYSINPQLCYRFYVDEPSNNMYHAYGKVNNLSKDTTGVPVNGATAARPPETLRNFIKMVKPNELLYNLYTIKPYTDTTSTADLDDPTNLQYAWDKLISDSLWWGAYRGMRQAATVTSDSGVSFWMTIQTSKETRWNPDSSDWICAYREPTRNEILCQAHLALCYGCKGIMYYLYPSFRWQSGNVGFTHYGLVDLVDSNLEPTWEYSGSKYIRNYRWYAVQEVNAEIDSLDDVLMDLNWINAYVSRPDSIAKYGSFVDSLYSNEYGTDTSFVEIGEFQHDNGLYYLMLVNRRCLADEDQYVSVCIDTTTHNFRVLYDVYENKTYHRTNGEFSNIPLEPGEGKLFELSNTLRVSGSINEDATWGDGFKYSVEGDVTVETYVTLTIEPGTIVEFAMTDNQHSGDDSTKCELIVYGTLLANGFSDSISFTSNAASPAKNDWYGIVLKDPASNSSRIKYCQIKYAHKGICCISCSVAVRSTAISNCDYGAFVDIAGTKLFMYDVACDNCNYGIRVQEGAAHLLLCDFEQNGVGIGYFSAQRYFPGGPSCQADIKNCDVTYNSSGIVLDDSSPIINYCDISHNSLWGLKCLDDSDPIIGENDLTNNGESSKTKNTPGDPKSPPQQHKGGLFCSGTSCPIVCDGPTWGQYERGWNVITDNISEGIHCGGQSSPKLGRGLFSDGRNSIYDNSVYDVYNSTGSTVWAEYNWWGDANGPDTAKIYGSVDWNPYLDEEPSKGKASGGSGRLALLEPRTKLSTRAHASPITKGQNTDSTGTAGEYNELGTYYLLQMMYDEAIEAFQYVLTNFSDCFEANYALVHLIQCYKEQDSPAQIHSCLGDVTSNTTNAELKRLALFMNISQLCREGKYSQAMSVRQTLLALDCDDDMEKSLRFREGMLYRYGLGNDQDAASAFQKFIQKYSDDPLAELARLELDIMGVSQPPKASPEGPATKQLDSVPEVFALYQNYPNPFNAQTRIEYELPKAARVSLKVYNVLGQCVKTLANDYQPAGHYQIVWDGRDGRGLEVASGIYFIRLEAGAYALTRKTVLLR